MPGLSAFSDTAASFERGLWVALSVALLTLIAVALSGRVRRARRGGRTIREVATLLAGTSAGMLVVGLVPTAMLIVVVNGATHEPLSEALTIALGAVVGAAVALAGIVGVRLWQRRAQRRTA